MTLSHQSKVMRVSWNEKQELERNVFPLWPVFSHASPFPKEILLDFSIFFHSQRISFRERGPTLCAV